MDPEAFYDLVKSPPASLIADYPWLQADPGRRAGRRLARGLPVAVELPRPARHDARGARPADARQVRRQRRRGAAGRPGGRGMTFYQVLVLASIVEREAAARRGEAADRRRLPEPARPEEVAARHAQSGSDRLLRPRHAGAGEAGVRRLASTRSGRRSRAVSPTTRCRPTLAGLQHLHQQGLPPGPICTPTLPSIDAALEPDTADGYLYFLAKGDGSGTSAFAKTLAEHQANIEKYLKK